MKQLELLNNLLYWGLIKSPHYSVKFERFGNEEDGIKLYYTFTDNLDLDWIIVSNRLHNYIDRIKYITDIYFKFKYDQTEM